MNRGQSKRMWMFNKVAVLTSTALALVNCQKEVDPCRPGTVRVAVTCPGADAEEQTRYRLAFSFKVGESSAASNEDTEIFCNGKAVVYDLVIPDYAERKDQPVVVTGTAVNEASNVVWTQTLSNREITGDCLALALEMTPQAPADAGSDGGAVKDAPVDEPEDMPDADPGVGGDAGFSCPEGSCAEGAKQCGEAGGVKTCVSNNGCGEWGPEQACPGVQTCISSGFEVKCECPPPPAGCVVGENGAFCEPPRSVAYCTRDEQGCVSISSRTDCPNLPCAGQFPNAACGECPAQPGVCLGREGTVCEGSSTLVTCAKNAAGCLEVSGRTTCVDDANPCTDTVCAAGACKQVNDDTNSCPGGSCRAGLCCTGCWDGAGACQQGTAVAACGSGGKACATCGNGGNVCADAACSSGSCTQVNDDKNSCPGGSCHVGACCTGCWNGSSCQPGNTVGACGKSGGACSSCSDDTNACTDAACSGGACTQVNDDNNSCSGGSCHVGACCVGCWNGSSCQAGNTIGACGKGGGTCSACPNDSNACTDAACNEGVCTQINDDSNVCTAGSCRSGVCCEVFVMPNPATAGLPNPASYTSGSGIVTDNVTKLVWEQPTTAAGFSSSFDDALKHCADKAGGWRLPTVLELYSLIDFTKTGSMIDERYFPNAPADVFWSSSVVAGGASAAWTVNFGDGSMSQEVLDVDYSVRCVRLATASSTCSRFSLSAGGSQVVDAKTGLTWQRGTAFSGQTWADAKAYCPTLGANFRLPSVKELLTIVDFAKTEPAIDMTVFSGGAGAYWTSSAAAGDSSQAWAVNFGVGDVSLDDVGKSDNLVRCVR